MEEDKSVIPVEVVETDGCEVKNHFPKKLVAMIVCATIILGGTGIALAKPAFITQLKADKPEVVTTAEATTPTTTAETKSTPEENPVDGLHKDNANFGIYPPKNDTEATMPTAATEPTMPTTPTEATVPTTPTEAAVPTTPTKTIGQCTVYRYGNKDFPGDYTGEMVDGMANGQGEAMFHDPMGDYTIKGNFWQNQPFGEVDIIYIDKDGNLQILHTNCEGIA